MASTRASETSLDWPYDSGAGGDVGEVRHADEAEPVHRLLAGLDLARLTDPAAEQQLAEVLAGLLLHGQHHVLQARDPADEAHVLERAHQSHAGHLVGVQPDQLDAVEQHRARVGPDEPGEQVEDRGLAGAVRADERGDGALAQLDGEVVGGDDAAEALADAVRLSTIGASCQRALAVSLSDELGVVAQSGARLVHRDRAGRHPVVDHLDAAAFGLPLAVIQRQIEKPSGSAPCGRSRISTTRARP